MPVRRADRRRGGIVERLAVLRKASDRGSDGNALATLGDHDAGKNAVIDGLNLHRRLVGLDLGDHVAAANGVADGDGPF